MPARMTTWTLRAWPSRVELRNPTGCLSPIGRAGPTWPSLRPCCAPMQTDRGSPPQSLFAIPMISIAQPRPMHSGLNAGRRRRENRRSSPRPRVDPRAQFGLSLSLSPLIMNTSEQIGRNPNLARCISPLFFRCPPARTRSARARPPACDPLFGVYTSRRKRLRVDAIAIPCPYSARGLLEWVHSTDLLARVWAWVYTLT